ncbi:hypothetical protein ACIQ4I_11870 [Rummeliibacillus sp. NPDC094406]|uniref:hypothetical protein n=1 Tax=Rummeliibacillus sp. NPDC094406 TaxID=3364511 RepID=UPI00380FECB5
MGKACDDNVVDSGEDSDHDDALGNALDMVYDNGGDHGNKQDVCHNGAFRDGTFLVGTCLPFNHSFHNHFKGII